MIIDSVGDNISKRNTTVFFWDKVWRQNSLKCQLCALKTPDFITAIKLVTAVAYVARISSCVQFLKQLEIINNLIYKV